MQTSVLPGPLRSVADAVEEARSAAILLDPEWTLLWTSSEFEWAMETDARTLGVGKHLLECYLTDAWCRRIAAEGNVLESFLRELPYMAHDTPGGIERLAQIVERNVDGLLHLAAGDPGDPDQRAGARAAAGMIFTHVDPCPQPPMWSHTIDWLQGDLPPMPIRSTAFRLHDPDGATIGTLITYDAALPGHVLALVARGDEGMFERMARLFEPGRHQAAILFADLQLSTTLSRRLPSAVYFRLVRAITSAVDDVVIRHRGIVGKHAGDGITSFFLAEDLGSSSRAARAAVEAARDIAVAVHDAAKGIAENTGLIAGGECLINVGVHWGGHLYMGQLVTGGRLEVTALGDRVNECARIQESAQDGQVLASKSLVERLDDADAAALALDPDGVLYRAVDELPGASVKARRDIPGMPVTVL